jgi:biopolymer transport protein ExbB
MRWIAGAIEMCIKGGFFMIPLGIIALVTIALVIERLLFLRENRLDSDRFQFELRAALSESNLDKAIVLAARTKGLIGRVIEECLLRLKDGEADVDDATEKVILTEMIAMERSRGWLIAFYQIAPLIGILGTIWGLIEAFMIIERSATTDAHLLAGGVYQALITTVAGLVVAIPILIFVEYLRKRSNIILSLLDIYLAEIRDWSRRRGNRTEAPHGKA